MLAVSGNQGSNDNGGTPVPTWVDSSEIYDPVQDVWTATNALVLTTWPAGGEMGAVTLPNGNVLVPGGVEYNLSEQAVLILRTASSYSSATTLWGGAGCTSSYYSCMSSGHYLGTLTLLQNGHALALGGEDMGPSTAYYYVLVSSAETYDPTSDAWTQVASMPSPTAQQAAVLLGNGKVLVVGGTNTTVLGIITTGSSSVCTSAAEIYDPVANTWTAAASMLTPACGPTATLLLDGTVLVTGGGTSEIYDPTANSWTTAGAATGNGPAVLLTSGDVLLISGSGPAEVYKPTTKSWSATGPMITPRSGSSAVLLPNGAVLVSGGQDASGNVLASSELFWE